MVFVFLTHTWLLFIFLNWEFMLAIFKCKFFFRLSIFFFLVAIPKAVGLSW